MLPKNTEDETTSSESTVTSNNEPMSLEPTVDGDMDAHHLQILPTAHVVKIRLVNEHSRMPQKATAGAAAFDVYSRGEAHSHGWQVPMTIPLGFCLQMPPGMYAKLHGRSGFARGGFIPHEGIIDQDYTGEVCIILHTAIVGAKFEAGERIGQITFHHCLPVEFEQVSEIRETARGAGGFGSTGTGALFRPTHDTESSSHPHMEAARQACLDVVQSPLGKRESPTREEDEKPRSPPALDASSSSGACEMALAPPPLPVITLSAAPEEPAERPTAATTGGVWR